MVSTPPPSQPDEQPLYWLPAGMRLESLPPGLRQAVQELLIPAFRELVTGAQGPLERLNAVSLVHLAWLELLQQSHMGAGMAGKVPPADQKNYAAAFDHHLKLITAKGRVARFHLEVEKFKRRIGRSL